MAFQILLWAGLRQRRGGLLGIFLLMFSLSLSLASVLSVWSNAGRYLEGELNRAGFGDLTAWVSGAPDTLSGEIADLPAVERVEEQAVIFTHYRLNGQESDSEGQLILYRPEERRYRFFAGDLSGYTGPPEEIQPGTVYVSPSLISMFGAELGDEITFPIARSGRNLTFKIAGWYEDPFMGSSMIGMKGFLIAEDGRQAALALLENAGIDALARDGAMLHLFAAGDGRTASDLGAEINAATSLPRYTEFVHSRGAVSGFMLALQNAFGGFLLAFAAVLLLAAMTALGHQIQSGIQEDFANLAILKTLGLTDGSLRAVQLVQYLAAILPGMTLGLLFAPPVSRLAGERTLTTTGFLVPAGLPLRLCLPVFALLLAVLAAFLFWKLGKLRRVTPMGAVRGEAAGGRVSAGSLPALSASWLGGSLALRQWRAGRGQYRGACLVAVLLVFFASLVGRMDAWLGPDGKGMMDAFNPADHDIGVQSFGVLTPEQFEETIRQYSEITGVYRLAMPGVTVNGVDHTANVITDPERFHLLEGRPCTGEEEIVITEFMAADFGVGVGDSLTVGADRGSGAFTVCGIYSCANEMGATIGMNREGYVRIGSDHPSLWCWHYFLADPARKEEIAGALKSVYGGDVHVHENTWPGLWGIIAAMRALTVFLYGTAALFILVVTALTSGKLLAAERRDLAIYRALGFASGRLRLTFALRFGITAAAGSLVGTALAAALTDPLVSAVMRRAGISSFASAPGLGAALFPGAAITLLFLVSGWLSAGRIAKIRMTMLAADG
ncbi:MAG: ABC transporter permease [Provencibacterium sp.]|nr:ABC transporter permease [Provencibacterium sp.]